MLPEPQIAAKQDKNYLKVLTPLIFTAAIFCHENIYAMAMRPYYIEYVSQQNHPPQQRTWSAKTPAPAEDAPAEDDQAAKKAEDKNIDPDDHDSADFVREVIPLWEKKSVNHRSWSEHVYDQLPELGPDLLTANPSDAKIFCPNYANLSESKRKQFWAFFISSMAKFESNFDPKEAYTEGFRDKNGKYIISRGLLQISIESSHSYRCGFKSTAEMHSPTRNLSCGIRILNHWMKKDRRIASKYGAGWRGGARYWSVLRAGKKTSYQSIVKWTNALPFCQL